MNKLILLLFLFGMLFVLNGFSIKDASKYRLQKNVKKEISSAVFPTLTPTKGAVLGEEKVLTPTATPTAVPNEQAIIVTKVIDGDTIEVEGHKKVRYIGIDTPEIHHPKKPVECFGKEAAIMNSSLVEGKEVRLEKDVSETDRYGRLLRYVYIGDLMVNDYLVRQGYAYAATFPPDVAYQEQFTQAEQEARENNRGLWSICN